MQIVLERMHKAEHPGSIVNISSIAAYRAIPGSLVYGMTKAALDQFTRGLAVDLASRYAVCHSETQLLFSSFDH